MITRLQVDGFKNLVDVDIHFGKFNVITGANGVGKSNLFDAINLISRISREPFSAVRLRMPNTEDADAESACAMEWLCR